MFPKESSEVALQLDTSLDQGSDQPLDKAKALVDGEGLPLKEEKKERTGKQLSPEEVNNLNQAQYEEDLELIERGLYFVLLGERQSVKKHHPLAVKTAELVSGRAFLPRKVMVNKPSLSNDKEDDKGTTKKRIRRSSKMVTSTPHELFIEACEYAAARTSESDSRLAIKYLLAGFGLRIFPSKAAAIARSLTVRNMESYYLLKNYREALKSKMTLALLSGSFPGRDHYTKCALLREVYREALLFADEKDSLADIALESDLTCRLNEYRFAIGGEHFLKNKESVTRESLDEILLGLRHEIKSPILKKSVQASLLLSLAELSANFNFDFTKSVLEECHKLSTDDANLSLAFQACSKLGSTAISRGDSNLSATFFRQAEEHATNMLFLSGRLGSSIAYIHAKLNGGSTEEAFSRLSELGSMVQNYSVVFTQGLSYISLLSRLGLEEEGKKRLSQTIELFESYNLDEYLSQALWLKGTLLTGAGEDAEAAQLFKKAILIDLSGGSDTAGSLDKLLVLAQNEVLRATHDRSRGFSTAEDLLKRAKDEIPAVPLFERPLLYARLTRLEAEVAFLAENYVESLKLLSAARGAFANDVIHRDVAAIDVMSGLVLFNLAKNMDESLFPESIQSFERARLAFNMLGALQESWRVEMYLAWASVASSSHAASEGEKRSLLNLADRHCEAAWRSHQKLSSQGILPMGEAAEVDFLGGNVTQLLDFAEELARNLLMSPQRFTVWRNRKEEVIKRIKFAGSLGANPVVQ